MTPRNPLTTPPEEPTPDATATDDATAGTAPSDPSPDEPTRAEDSDATDAGRGVDPAESLAEVENEQPETVAALPDNLALEHTDGGVTTRMDATDVGVPMLQGSGNEPQGPEDALGPGPKRGDYTGRMGFADYQPTQTERIPDAKPGEPHTRLVAQRPRAEEIGEVEGKKGGVDTATA